MLELILSKKQITAKAKISIKTLLSVVLVALAAGLPQLVHLAMGPTGGIQYLPMYLPILLGGCLLGIWWGLGVAIAAPLFSFFLTSLLGNPMPALSRLPFMITELMVFASISGLFSKKIATNYWLAFPAVLFAEVAGRLFFLLSVAIFQNISSLSVTMVWNQILNGLLGVVIQAVMAPTIIVAVLFFLNSPKKI